jgi:hypothetical protein
MTRDDIKARGKAMGMNGVSSKKCPKKLPVISGSCNILSEIEPKISNISVLFANAWNIVTNYNFDPFLQCQDLQSCRIHRTGFVRQPLPMIPNQ